MSILQHQTLATGSTALASKYGSLGGVTGGTEFPPIGAVNAVIFGYPGEGKSFLYQSHPDAFIFNLDESRVVTRSSKATMWPFINEKGQVLGDGNQPIVLTWDMIEAKCETLKRLARENQPRPQTVVFDSVSAMIRLLIPYLVKKGGKSAWRELHGQTAWDELYNIITNTMTSLHSYGYGVHYVLHLKQVKIPQGEHNVLIRPEPQISDSLWHRLFGNVEFSGHLFSEKDVRDVEKDVTIQLKGQTVTQKQIFKETFRARYLSVTTPELLPYLKARTIKPLPDRIPLPDTDTWQSFDSVYSAVDK